MKPYDLKCISVTATQNLENWIVRPGWVFVTCSGTVGRVSLSTSKQDGWAASQHILRIVPKKATSHPGFIAAFLMTPFGQHQVTGKVYGGVVDELTAEDMWEVLIPNAPYDLQKEIGDPVVRAFEMRDEANGSEDQAVAELENLIAEARHKKAPQHKEKVPEFE